ncbi:DUF3025 domain-containing protein [sulfur-oxidizing endosymbiont of Gigantopelta aegis]|uniref:DUF3025 domain-containing protein n=1 Tax=sulfur-oxidizing endosymbiont of Gigantopelta aegis TaxID=2794934 RepID=UPI0018DE7ABF|nr:DUF3025 domain-containing protein [sulfur-oxidizing endosymbiont of Gigantopelta aegis]
MAKNINNDWDSHFLEQSLIFADLKLLLEQSNWTDWPGSQGLLALLDKPVILSSGHTLAMHPQDETLPFPDMGYEERVYKKGIISTREQNWHDLFNALIWVLFPQTKILLNSLHIQELERQPGKKRTPARDAITHLDESGIIIASSNPTYLQALKDHQWQSVFLQARSHWFSKDGFSESRQQQSIGAFVFGHGMYEKAFTPFIGFTGKAYCLEVDDNFFQCDKMSQYKKLDQLLSSDIKTNNSLADSSYLSPLPILGIPGWAKENESPEYYQNTNYFRPKIRHKAKS